jgi:hypothetical protein
VHDQRIARRQANELVLPATLDAPDYRATQPSDVTRRQATALRWVQNFHVADCFPHDGRAQDAGRILDFG